MDVVSDEVTLVGERHSWHAHRIRSFLDRNIVEYRWVDADQPEGQALLERLSEDEPAKLPVLFVSNGPTLAQPTNVSLARCLGLATRPSLERYDLVIVGAGPAGLAAAVYGSSEGLSTAMIEREAPGGQAGQSSLIENYLGFPDGLSGSELTRAATRQARRFGAEIVQPSEAIALEAERNGYAVELSDHTVLKTRGAVIATGVEYRRLRAPGVAELVGAGVYYGAGPSDADDCQERDIFVVGGANSAGQAVVNFAGKARRVTMLVRGDSLAKSMSQYLIDKIERLSNVEVLTNTELAEAHGNGYLEAISLKRDGEPMTDRVGADAVFIFIGAVPHTDWLKGVLARDDRGFILSGRDLAMAAREEPHWLLERSPFRARDESSRRVRRGRFTPWLDQAGRLGSGRGIDGGTADPSVS